MSYTIQLQPCGIDFDATAEETILDAGLKHKLALAHSCRQGDCGLCTATVIQGLVRNELGHEVQNGCILTCSSYAQSDLVLQASYIPELADIQCVTLPCKVDSVCFNTEDILTLTLRLPPTANFHYLPGQYIDLIYKGVRRSYSIANAPSVSGIELHIRLLNQGAFSHLLTEQCKPNELMRLEGPKGTFFVRKNNKPIIFVAGGTGFAPIKAMMEQLIADKDTRPVHLYWGVTEAQYFYNDSAINWLNQYNGMHYIPVVSGEDNTWSGRKGLVHEAVLQDFADLSAFEVYACGSSLMINNAKETFVARGLAEADFYADIFVPHK